MKQLSFLLLLFFSTTLQAKNYYISAVGNDANDGQTTATAWQTLSKINSYNFGSGDVVLFRRGDSFYGSIIVPADGLSFDAYGTGALPIISGFTTASSWKNTGGGIWSSNIAAAGAGLIVVTIDNKLQRLGRYPNADASNAGYLIYSGVSGTSLTGPAQSSTTNWNGAEIAVRKLHWVIDRCRVTAHNGGTISYTNPTGVINSPYPGKAGFGYFFQDDIRTLDQVGEWFLNKSTKDLSVYFGSLNPSSYSVKVSTVDMLLNCGGGPDGKSTRNNINVSNLSFEGANNTALYSGYGAGITIKNCTFNNNYNAIYLNNNANSVTQYNAITNCLNNGIEQTSYASYSTVIQYNIIKNVGTFAGMGGSGDGTYTGIAQSGDNTTIEYNKVDLTGYGGIVFAGNNAKVNYNYVTNFCSVKDDGGGIYTASDFGKITQYNRVISYNIVDGGRGAMEGTPNFTAPGTTYDAHGIYMDAGANHATVHHNTVANLPQGQAIFLNLATDLTVSNNTYYNVLKGTRFDRMPNFQLIRNIIYTGNISYPTTNNFFYWNGSLNSPVSVDIQTDMRAMFEKIDSNYYRNDLTAPFDWFYHLSDGGSFGDPGSQNFSQWQNYINGESHSQVLSTAANVFQYNASNSPVEYAFAGSSKKDAYGTVYNNSATIPAWGSKILFDNGAAQGGNTAPVANAGTDKIITLPTKTTTLSGSGTDVNGTISSYAWVNISGPSNGTIVTANAASTTVNNLVQGVYKYELTVKDNNGATDKDTVQVTVNASANQAPTANAGADKTITLPSNTATLSGSGTDANGTISSYAWVSISGPSTGTIITANAASTTVNNLLQGVYKYELTVTDNNGATDKDTVQVTVNAIVANQIPVANAGTDQTITLPVNTATLAGSGKDANGTINSYAWVSISGPSTGTIVTPNAATTAVNNLAQGVYKFELTVTDNGGAIKKDTIQVTVNAAINTPPLANAGTDKVITLPTNSVTLAGSGKDANGTISSYSWVGIAGPSTGTIAKTNAVTTAVNNLVQGIYKYELTVTDNNGAIGKDTVQVTVNASFNQPPVANAGADKTITLPTNSVTLTGVATDANGTISSYKWVKVSGPAKGTIVKTGAASTAVNSLLQGIYQFELSVTDNNGAIGKDTVQVNVNGVINTPPVANAGTDKTIVLPINTVTLSGSGADANGTVSSYAWVKIAGPASGTIATSNAVSTVVNNLVQGVYKYELTVTDNNGGIDKDTVQVTVNASANQAPIANAGTDKVVSLPTNTTTLSGTGTDANGSISSYSWVSISGPSTGTIATSNAASTAINNLLQGVYKYELTVTDNNGAIGKDTVQVTVNAGLIQVPLVNAGVDKIITLPTNTVTLAGTATNGKGTISSYTWVKISGPVAGTIVTANAATTIVNNLVEGVYKFEFSATNNGSASAKDTVQVTVNRPVIKNKLPTANAGADINIVLPTDTAQLTGTATDTDGSITSYNWKVISGSTGCSIADASASHTKIEYLSAGVYDIELTIADDSGAIAKDTLRLTVSPAIRLNYNAYSFQVYPNPVKDVANVKIDVNNGVSNTKVLLNVVNISGLVVKTKALLTFGSSTNFKLDMSDIIDGFYIIVLTFENGEKLNYKIVKHS